MNKKSFNTQNFILTAMFAAIIFLLAFTPIGYIRTGFINATIIHIPVIVGSIILGPKTGSFLGFLFGITSIISNTFTPTILSFVFSPLIPVPGIGKGNILALIICFLPRILVGFTPYYVYHLFEKVTKGKMSSVSLIVAGVAGSMTNTLLVMHLIFLIFQDAYANVREIPIESVYRAVLIVIGVNGGPEAIVAGLLTVAVGKAILVYRKSYQRA